MDLSFSRGALGALLLGLGALLASPGEAMAQCTEGCAVFHGDDGEVIGHGCVDFGDPTGQTNCFATSGGCSSSDCRPRMTLLQDAAGLPAVYAVICDEAGVTSVGAIEAPRRVEAVAGVSAVGDG